jgi:acetyltransferase-like isoleucine patch superfamily enzyme
MIGHDGILRVPVFTVGDYAAIHNHVLINGYEPCTVGHNTFVGQHSVLNSTAKLTIGNNFRMGTNGYVWTHAESGELLEGCTIYSQRPVVIEDDVWLAGCNNSISPGLRIRRGTIILIGSNITHDTEAWHCYGGSPAQDLTDKLVPYRPVTHHEKVTMMREFAAAFVESTPEFSGAVEFVARAGDPVSVLGERIVVAADGGPQPYDDSTSVFSISDKTYIKVRSVIEQKFMRFLVGARARFLPVE